MKWVICLDNAGFKESLELRKLYPLIDDEASAQRGCVRVIDESGEDYVYPSDMFLPLPVAVETEARLLALA
ncbi:hypothetical protein FACS1894116_12700 [Betaproteobacteria bacterium]|nr:hypothetical protein FACS1894116_12700 [Betaproteobacteria bacterium]GHU25072.1 hypothetical protein FACS189488_11160 [Betaproteobacteria bacterium]GHU28815.1 hypothetical protein FACS189497_05250 [Betaproteobacteria bacterium]